MDELKIIACACAQPRDTGHIYCNYCKKMLRKWIYTDPAPIKELPKGKKPGPKLCVCESPVDNGYNSCVRCKKKLPLFMRKKTSPTKSKNKNEPAHYAYSKDETCACALPIENGDGTCWECHKMLPVSTGGSSAHIRKSRRAFVPPDCECAEDRAKFGNDVTCTKCQVPCVYCVAWNFKTDTECATCRMSFSYRGVDLSGAKDRPFGHNPNRNDPAHRAHSRDEMCLCMFPNENSAGVCRDCHKPLTPRGGQQSPARDTNRNEAPLETFPALSNFGGTRLKFAPFVPPKDDDDDALLQLALRLSLEELDTQQDTYLTNFVEDALVLVPHIQTVRALSTVGFHVSPIDTMPRSAARWLLVAAHYKDPASHIHRTKMPRDVVARILLLANLATVHMMNKWMKWPL